jgi:hypothetical protein
VGVAVDIAIPGLLALGSSEPSLPELPPLIVPMPLGTIEIEVAPDLAPRALAPTPDARSPVGSVPSGDNAAGHSTTATRGASDASADELPQHRAEPAARTGGHRPARGENRPFVFAPPLGAAGSSTSAGGTAPSASNFGLATVTGFFAFAVPGLGRRIRLARIPSPRSRPNSPLDRPG